MHKQLSMDDRLGKLGFHLDFRCFICHKEAKDLDNIFLVCHSAQTLWSHLGARFRVPITFFGVLFNNFFYGYHEQKV